jgi:hypothetical protein
MYSLGIRRAGETGMGSTLMVAAGFVALLITRRLLDLIQISKPIAHAAKARSRASEAPMNENFFSVRPFIRTFLENIWAIGTSGYTSIVLLP